jgi:signal transduction histidine kinase/CheY-like chemotaxis protein
VHGSLGDTSGDTSAERCEPRATGQPLQILVVDDAQRNLDALEAALAGLDARVVKARSGAEALRQLLHQEFALVLLDVRMPALDGFETAELIRARDCSRETPIIFLTAYDHSREEETRGYALGAADFLAKPVVPEVLRSKVAVLIELQRKTDEVRRQAALLQAAERRDHERALAEERRRWDEEALRKEVERERAVAATMHRSNARLRLLTDVARDLLLRTDLDSIAARLFLLVNEHVGIQLCLHHRAREGALVLEGRAGVELGPASPLERLAPGEHFIGRAAAERRLVVAEDEPAAAEPPFAALRAAGLSACAAFPLVAGGHLHGVITFGSGQRGGFGPEELAALGLVCDQIAAALERERLVDELREADARKDRFLAMLGHELRNPLAPVLNALTVVDRTASLSPPVKGLVAGAERQIALMRRLLDDLLDISRIRSGKIELDRRRVDVARVVEDAVASVQAVVEERAQRLEVDVSGEALAVWGDAVRLRQAVGNLLHNAAKYTPREGNISLRAGRAGGDVVLTVADDGIGIDAEVLPRIFEPFVQGERVPESVGGGLGLGLALVRTIVELHGGSATARSAGRGQGAELELRLPAAPEADAAVEDRANGHDAPADGHDARAHGIEVAVVEDNRDIRESLRMLLELRGCAVAEADDGPAGLELIRRRSPEVALVDIDLPGLDGYALARALRAERTPTRLVAVTGFGGRDERQRALDAGFDAHLTKPFHFDDLSRLLDTLA